jgi:hypothetical protein
LVKRRKKWPNQQRTVHTNRSVLPNDINSGTKIKFGSIEEKTRGKRWFECCKTLQAFGQKFSSLGWRTHTNAIITMPSPPPPKNQRL